MIIYESVNDVNVNNIIIERNEMVKEIERLNKQIEEYQKALDETTSEKIDLENIIKEKDKRIHLALGYMENCSGEPDWRHVYAILDGVDDTYDKN